MARNVIVAGIILGLGLGGFVDGILLHQILQWHHMATSASDPAIAENVALNTTLDGIFHAATWVLVVIGIALLIRAWRTTPTAPRTRDVLGAALAGWGIFNVVEGIVDHHILGLHHVWPQGPGGLLAWDLGFLAFGGLLITIGWAMVHTGAAEPRRRPRGRGRPG